MGIPQIGTPHEVAGFTATPVDVGNPHVVIFVDDLSAIDVARARSRGSEATRAIPDGVNVHFAQVAGKRVARGALGTRRRRDGRLRHRRGRLRRGRDHRLMDSPRP